MVFSAVFRAFFEGGWGKTGVKTWCFDGKNVVKCVIFVDAKMRFSEG